MDPGRVRGGGGGAHRQPRPAGRGLRRGEGQGAPSRRARLPRGRRARGVRARLRAARDQGQRACTAAATRCSRRSAGRSSPGWQWSTRARTGCDTIAHGCTGKGNDQVRIESTVVALDPSMKIIAPVRGWQMGREEEIAYAREHGIPVKGGTETPPYSIDDNLWGRSSEGGPIEDIEEPPRDDVFQLVTRPEEAPDEAEDVRDRVRARRAGGAERRAARPGRAARAGRRDRRPARRRDRGPHRGPHRRAEGARPLRGARRGADPDRPQGAREAGRHDPPEHLQAAPGRPLGLPRLRRPLVRAAACRT